MSNINRKIEPVFCADEDWKFNACINWTHDAFELYVMGYKQAADTLAEYVITSERHLDSLIYPIAFLYRQYIELRLKSIIKDGRMFLDKGHDFPKHHKLWELWCDAKKIANEVFANEPKPFDLDYAEHVIKEFSQVDPDSFAFRYPISKKGDKTLDGLRHINIRRLAEHIEKLSEDLGTIGNCIAIYLDYKRDMYSSY